MLRADTTFSPAPRICSFGANGVSLVGLQARLLINDASSTGVQLSGGSCVTGADGCCTLVNVQVVAAPSVFQEVRLVADVQGVQAPSNVFCVQNVFLSDTSALRGWEVVIL